MRTIIIKLIYNKIIKRVSFPIFFSNDLFRDCIPSLTSLPGLTAQAAAFSTDVAAQHVAATA